MDRTASIMAGCIGAGLCCLLILGPVEPTVEDNQQQLVSIVMRDRRTKGEGKLNPLSEPEGWAGSIGSLAATNAAGEQAGDAGSSRELEGRGGVQVGQPPSAASLPPPAPQQKDSGGHSRGAATTPPSPPAPSSSSTTPRKYIVPPLRAVTPVSTPTVAQAVQQLEFSQFACLAVGRRHTTTKHANVEDPKSCAAACAAEGYPVFGISTIGGECWCTDKLDAPEDVFADASKCDKCAAGDRSCEVKRQPRSLVYNVTSALPEIIMLYIAPAKRTSCLFNSGRLEQFFTGRFAVRKKPFNAQLTKTDARWYREVCKDNIGKKIFVQITGAVVHLLKHFPDNSLLIMTADEVGNWGLGKGDRRFGPHGGKHPDFDTDETSEHKHIVLPDEIWPMFRQYYHYRQIEAFGGSKMRFVPLGSRAEFATIEGPAISAPDRKYVYSYMAALTDGTRRKVAELLQNDKEIGEDKRFMQISQNWHGQANNDEYVSPEKYQKIMQDSVFSICPKGHSVEQFRIYEAIESGSIPVMELHSTKVHGYLEQHLPPEYITSPMLLLDSWSDVVPEMLKLWRDPEALRKRQKDLLEWYDHFMRNKMVELEDELIERGKGPAAPFCSVSASMSDAAALH